MGEGVNRPGCGEGVDKFIAFTVGVIMPLSSLILNKLFLSKSISSFDEVLLLRNTKEGYEGSIIHMLSFYRDLLY